MSNFLDVHLSYLLIVLFLVLWSLILILFLLCILSLPLLFRSVDDEEELLLRFLHQVRVFVILVVFLIVHLFQVKSHQI